MGSFLVRWFNSINANACFKLYIHIIPWSHGNVFASMRFCPCLWRKAGICAKGWHVIQQRIGCTIIHLREDVRSGGPSRKKTRRTRLKHSMYAQIYVNILSIYIYIYTYHTLSVWVWEQNKGTREVLKGWPSGLKTKTHCRKWWLLRSTWQFYRKWWWTPRSLVAHYRS